MSEDWRTALADSAALDAAYLTIGPHVGTSTTPSPTSGPETTHVDHKRPILKQRRMTTLSTAVLQKLSVLDKELAHFREELQWYADDIGDENCQMSQLVHIKNKSHQFAGNLEKFQYVKVDSVTTGQLTTGKEKAKEMRKRINNECESMRSELLNIIERLDERVLQLKELAKLEQAKLNPIKTGSPTSTPPQTGTPPKTNGNSWLDNLPTASDSLQIQLLRTKTLPSPFGKLSTEQAVAASPESVEGPASAHHSLRKALSRSDTFRSDRADSTGVNTGDESEALANAEVADGTILTPEWTSIQKFANLHAPIKPSSTRYTVSMLAANLQPSPPVLSFLYTPAAHAHALRLSDRPLSLPELDILGRLFAASWHHACKLRELRLNNMMIGDTHIAKLGPYLAGENSPHTPMAARFDRVICHLNAAPFVHYTVCVPPLFTPSMWQTSPPSRLCN